MDNKDLLNDIKNISTNESPKNVVSSDGLACNPTNCPPDMTPIKLSDEYHTKIIIVRHGESLGNAARMFLGHSDQDLSERGYLQAERTGELLSTLHIDKIYSSDLLRAYNTAFQIAKHHNLEVEKSRGLREIFLGEWEGMTTDAIEIKYPELFNTWKNDFGNAVCPGGESTSALQNRIYDEVLRLAKLNEGKTIVLAFHGAAIRMFWARILGVSLDDLNNTVQFAYNASVSLAYFDNGKFIPAEHSHMAHLTDI